MAKISDPALSEARRGDTLLAMPGEGGALPRIRKLLEHGDLSFRDFMEVSLYDPELGYYGGARSPVGRGGDFVTSPALSPVFSYAIGRLVREFVDRAPDGPSTVVDIGCGDGSLIRSLAAAADEANVRFVGVDRSLDRAEAAGGKGSHPVTFSRTLDRATLEGRVLAISNELFDAIPFSRLVRRGEHLHELWVTEREGALDWVEREASAEYEDYFAERGLELGDGQFADVSLEWERTYEDICRSVGAGLIVTFDYGYPQSQLFHPRARRFGTAAAYSGHRVSRDLLARPGEQDLTAHVNFDDLQRAGERRGFGTRFFDRQAKFLLALGVTAHELFRPSTDVSVGGAEEAIELLERRDAARQLVLPDGIGHDIRVLVQSNEPGTWSFERPLF